MPWQWPHPPLPAHLGMNKAAFVHSWVGEVSCRELEVHSHHLWDWWPPSRTRLQPVLSAWNKPQKGERISGQGKGTYLAHGGCAIIILGWLHGCAGGSHLWCGVNRGTSGGEIGRVSGGRMRSGASPVSWARGCSRSCEETQHLPTMHSQVSSWPLCFRCWALLLLGLLAKIKCRSWGLLDSWAESGDAGGHPAERWRMELGKGQFRLLRKNWNWWQPSQDRMRAEKGMAVGPERMAGIKNLSCK